MPTPKRRRKKPVYRHWSGESLFVHAEGDHRNLLLTAWQVKNALDESTMSPEHLLTVIGMPGRKIQAQRVVELLMAKGSRWEIRDYAVPLPQTLPRTVPPSLKIGHPQQSEPTADEPEAWWVKFLTFQNLLWVGLAYCVLGFGFDFFLSANPEPTTTGILGTGFLALLKSVALLAGLAIWAGMMASFWRSEAMNMVIGALFVLGTLVGATSGYRAGFAHLNSHQLAPLPRLVERCMEEGVVHSDYRVGAECVDGWNSRATGSGACSHHGGVAYWKYKETQTRSVAQCQTRARRESWN